MQQGENCIKHLPPEPDRQVNGDTAGDSRIPPCSIVRQGCNTDLMVNIVSRGVAHMAKFGIGVGFICFEDYWVTGNIM